jgi:hypothetical protein
MTMQLYVIYDSTTLDFQASGYILMDGFFPETPDYTMESITDQFMVLITASDADDLRDKIGAISLMLEHARRHKDDSSAAWLYFSPDDPYDPGGTIPEWMTKIVNGMVMYDANLDRNWRRNKAVVTVVIEHKPYWDSSIEVQVPLTNGNGTDNITGLTIYNHDDSGTGHDNWIQINDEDVEGDMPGRTRLEITNIYASGRLYTAWIGHNWTDPTNFTHILEGENSTLGTPTSDGGCSGGYYMAKALASGSEDNLFTWTLSDSFLNTCKGHFFKIMARFYSAAPTQVKFRMTLAFAGTTIWQSGQVTLDSSRLMLIRDLLTLRLPPWLIGQTDLSELTMTLTGQQTTGSSVNVYLDFLQITPLDGWRMMECIGYGILQNSRLVDDGIHDVAYVDTGSGSDKAGYLVSYGNPITLYPAKDQKLYFLMHSNVMNTAEIARTATVKLYYRPRRRGL